jgi:hypothetical protein
MRFLNTLGSQGTIHWATETVSSAPGTNNEWRKTVAGFDSDKDVIHAVERLFTAQWFERLRVWPEIRLANHSGLVLHGYDRILWQVMLNAACALLRASTFNDHLHLHDRLQEVIRIGAPIGDRLEFLADITRHCKCEDPRDRLFALKSLLPERQADVITPNYTKSIGESYRAFMVSYAVGLGSLDILGLCNLSNSLDHMPTRVVDWSNLSAINVTQITNLFASGESSCEVKFVGWDVLEAVGAHCSTITSVRPCFDADTFSTDFGRTLSQLRLLNDLNMPYVAGGDMLGAYCRTFVPDNVDADRYVSPPARIFKLEDARKALLEIASCNWDTKGTSSPNTVGYLYRSELLLEDYVFFTTETGHFGISLAKPKVYDQVVGLLGCRSLMLLRPIKCGNSVVGRCYIQVLMDAEALLGPLPGRWRQVLRLRDGSQEWYPAFAQETTGKVQATDPRLGPLPAGWCLENH